jgi:hypothetical protein
MDIGPIFFKEISFFDFLEEWIELVLCQRVTVWERKIVKQIFLSQSRPNVVVHGKP